MGKTLRDTGQPGEYHAAWYQAVVHAHPQRYGGGRPGGYGYAAPPPPLQEGYIPNLEIPKGCITCHHNGNRTTCY
jgi:hypothetical protein